MNLLKLEWQLTRNRWKTLKETRKLLYGFVAFLGVMIGIYIINTIMKTSPVWPDSITIHLFTLLFMIVLLLTMITGIPEMFNHLFTSDDLSFLNSLPIKKSSIFQMKLIRSFVGGPTLIAIISIVSMYYFLYYSGASLHLLWAGPLMCLSMVFLGLTLSAFINLGLVQILPKSRAKELMTVMSGVTTFILVMMFQVPNLLNTYDHSSVNVLERIPSFPNWFPFVWLGKSMLAAKTGEQLPLLILVPIGFFVLSFIIFILSLSFTEMGMGKGFSKLHGQSIKKKRNSNTKNKFKVYKPRKILIIKEWRMIQRDVREWMAIAPLAVLIIVPFVFMASNQELANQALTSPYLSWAITQVGILFMFSYGNSMLMSSSFGREGENVDFLQSLPIKPLDILISKLVANWVLVFILVAVLEGIATILFHWQIHYLLIGLVAIAILSLGISGISLYIGLTGARYNPNKVNERINGVASFVIMVVSFIYFIFAVMIWACVTVPANMASNLEMLKTTPISFLYNVAVWKGDQPLLVTVIGIVVLLLFSFGALAFGLYNGSKLIQSKGLRKLIEIVERS
ncbi:ABC-2 type transport system permease protein [Bacillus pakistanensis]|uniref:ABC-2 type transport system permease protein n=1 Tax=Rossellomorea pakistanensis TaxID=992288 RepID=A0ABS2NJM5_9BACI|nr:hypothetical protein [Bacillus pakistanensis]MBM7588057.1 ABC-2 type transport system permease protein [Bacillus pakistanensis]